eukprot:GFYU01002480.1.p1 GENE.GFYU01002480.1~~GFYU01002480.1.p1  ORF type:complete len:560 (-),score=92.31 GFYU01002480.1:80-1759(-)
MDSLVLTLSDWLSNGLTPLILVGHCVSSAVWYREHPHTRALPQHWFQSVITSLFCGFGGSFLVDLVILGRTPRLLVSNSTVPVFFLCWYLISYSPGDVAYRMYFTRAVKTTILLTECIDLGRSVYSRVEDTYVMHPGSHVAALVSGTLAGCGGTLVKHLEQSLTAHDGPIRRPTGIVRNAFVASLLYVCVWNALPTHYARVVLFMFWFVLNLARHYYGVSLLHVIDNVFYKSLSIPKYALWEGDCVEGNGLIVPIEVPTPLKTPFRVAELKSLTNATHLSSYSDPQPLLDHSLLSLSVTPLTDASVTKTTQTPAPPSRLRSFPTETALVREVEKQRQKAVEKLVRSQSEYSISSVPAAARYVSSPSLTARPDPNPADVSDEFPSQLTKAAIVRERQELVDAIGSPFRRLDEREQLQNVRQWSEQLGAFSPEPTDASTRQRRNSSWTVVSQDGASSSCVPSAMSCNSNSSDSLSDSNDNDAYNGRTNKQKARDIATPRKSPASVARKAAVSGTARQSQCAVSGGVSGDTVKEHLKKISGMARTSRGGVMHRRHNVKKKSK